MSSSYYRVVFYHSPWRILVSSAPTLSVLYFNNYRSTAQLILFPALFRSAPRSDLFYHPAQHYGARRFESTKKRLGRRRDVFLQHAFKSALLCVLRWFSARKLRKACTSLSEYLHEGTFLQGSESEISIKTLLKILLLWVIHSEGLGGE